MEKSKKGDIRKFFKVKKPTASDTQQKPEEGDDGEKKKLQKGEQDPLKKGPLHSHHERERESEEGEQQSSSSQGMRKMKIQIHEEAEESLRRKKIEVSGGEEDAIKKKGEGKEDDEEEENNNNNKKKKDGLKEDDMVEDQPSHQKNKWKTSEKMGREKEDSESDEHQSKAMAKHRKKRRLIRDRSPSSEADEGYESHTHHKRITSEKQQVNSTTNEEGIHASSSSHSSLGESKAKLKRGALESFLKQKDSVGTHSRNSSKRGLDEKENSKEREKKKMTVSASSSMKKKTGGEVITDVDAFFSAAVEKDIEKALSGKKGKTKDEKDTLLVGEDEDASEDERENKTKKGEKDREVFGVSNDEEERERKKDVAEKQHGKIHQQSAKQWTAMLNSMKPSKLRGGSERVSDDDEDDVEKQEVVGRKKVAAGGSRELKKEDDDDEDYVDDEDDDEDEDSDSEEEEDEDEEVQEEEEEEDERERSKKTKENKKNKNKVSSKSTSSGSSKRSGSTVSSSPLSSKKRLKTGEGLQVTWTQKDTGPSNGMKGPSGSSRTSTSKSVHRATSAGDGVPSTDLPLSGKTFVLTGVLDSMSREEAVGKILRLGGRCTSAVSGKTDYLVTGSILEDGREVSTGSKYRKALQLQTEGGSSKKGGKSLIQIVNESEFLSMLGKTHTNLPHAEGQHQTPSLQEEKKDKGSYHTSTSISRLSPSLSSTSSSSGGGGGEEERSFERDSGSILWTEKYRPMHAEDLVGNREQMRNLQTWLSDWKDVCLLGKKKDPPAYRGYSSPYSSMMIAGGGGFIPPLNFNARAALLSGPPGVGKTTAARVAAKMAGYHVIEFNASDVRNKLHVEEIGDMTSGGQNLHVFIDRKNQKKGFMGGSGDRKKEGGQEEKDAVKKEQEKREEEKKKTGPQYGGVCVLMDEVDGLSGGDRGGAQAIVKLIETSKCPIICICNDRMHPKVRTIASKCLDIRFQPPHISAVRQRVQSILAAENLSLSLTSIDELCESMGGDLRQILNALQMYAYEKRDEQRTASLLLSQEEGDKDFTKKTSEDRLKGEMKNELTDAGKSLSVSQESTTESSPSSRPAPSVKFSTVSATATIGAVGLKDDQVMHGPFDSCKQLLDSSQACKLSRSRKLDRFFTDYDLMPLLIQENYLEAFRQAGVLASSPSGSSSSQAKRAGGGSHSSYYSRDSASQTKNQPLAATPSTTPSPGGGGHLVGRKVGAATSGGCNPSLLINLVSGAASDLVEVDVMSTVLRGDQHWGLLPDIGFLCCVFLPSKVERVGGFVGRVQFPSWLGRNSTQTKHKRLLTELLILFLNDSRRCTNSTGLKMSGYLDAIYRKCVAPLLDSGGGQAKGAGGRGGKSQNCDRSSKEEMIDRALRIMDDYNVSRNMLIENLQCLRLKSETRLYDLLDTRLKTAFTRMYNTSAHAKKQASAIVAATSHAKKKKMKKRNSVEGDDREGRDEEDDEGMLRSRTSGGEAEGDGSGGGFVQDEEDDDLVDDDFIVSTAIRGGGRGKPRSNSKLVTPSPGRKGGGRVKKEPTSGRGEGGKRGGGRGGGQGGGAGSTRR